MPHPKAFVIGDPIAHSKSPLIHNHWLSEARIDGSYTAIRVPPTDLSAFIDSVRRGDFVGGNVTIPHKEAVLPLCDVLDSAATKIGAVNTLVMNKGKLEGRNTDLTGFLANLDAHSPGWDQKLDHALVLGAGGAARAIICGLVERGVGNITILNRTETNAIRLSKALDGPLRAGPLSAFADLAKQTQLVVNTTAIGMNGTQFDDLSLADLPKTAIVTDIVYTPLETPLLARARAQGLRAVDGLGMLLHQAVPGFAAWFGKTPKVTDRLRALVEQTLAP